MGTGIQRRVSADVDGVGEACWSAGVQFACLILQVLGLRGDLQTVGGSSSF